MTLGGLRNDLDSDPEAAVAQLTAAVEATRRIGAPDILLRGINNLSSMQRGLGRAEEAAALAREGLESARGNGLQRNIGTILTGNLAEALMDLGRIDEAEQVLAECHLIGVTGTHAEFLDRMRGELALLRGDLPTAAAMLAQARAANRIGQLQHSVPIARLALRIAAGVGRPLEARAELIAALDEDLRCGYLADLYPLLVDGAAAEADSRGLPEADRGRAEVLARIASTAAGLTPTVPLHHGWARLLEAELARAEGAGTPSSGPPRSRRCARPGCRTRWRSRCCGPARPRCWPDAANPVPNSCARRGNWRPPGPTPHCGPRSTPWPRGPDSRSSRTARCPLRHCRPGNPSASPRERDVLRLLARGAPTGRSPRNCTSRRRPRACTSPTSSASSRWPAGARRPRWPTGCGCSPRTWPRPPADGPSDVPSGAPVRCPARCTAVRPVPGGRCRVLPCALCEPPCARPRQPDRFGGIGRNSPPLGHYSKLSVRVIE